MRFKDKNGNILVDIATAKEIFCRNTDSCVSQCTLNHHGMSCDEYVNTYPVEAARYMGLEIIEDTGMQSPIVALADALKTMATQPTRESILEAAKRCVCGDREQNYGSPEDNFQTIANLWIDYLAGKGYPLDIEPHDVAAMLGLLKIARIASGHAKEDNWIDLAGYAACGGEIQGGRSE